MKLPWYEALENGLQPIEPHIKVALIGLAIITLFIAWKGDAVSKMAWFIYLVSP